MKKSTSVVTGAFEDIRIRPTSGIVRSIAQFHGGIRASAPGIAITFFVGLAARLLGQFSGVIPDVVIALVVGIIINNVFRLPQRAKVGVKPALHYGVRSAIILLGASMNLGAVVGIGSETLLAIVTLVFIAMILGVVLAHLFRLPGVIGILIGAGTAICGGSAIITVGPLTRASDEEIAYAISTIFSFNVIALLLFPPLGHALGLDDTAFGTWAGTAINDTAVVVATGYAYSSAAGAVATIVKLTRTVMLVPLALIIGVAFAAHYAHEDTRKKLAPNRSWKKAFASVPWFVLGFLAVSVASSLGAFSTPVVQASTVVARFLIVGALAAVGLNVDLHTMRKLGFRPFITGLVLASTMALVSFVLLRALAIA
jgi:uncharacterized integral membrane protein (TIGR00698 family)